MDDDNAINKEVRSLFSAAREQSRPAGKVERIGISNHMYKNLNCCTTYLPSFNDLLLVVIELQAPQSVTSQNTIHIIHTLRTPLLSRTTGTQKLLHLKMTQNPFEQELELRPISPQDWVKQCAHVTHSHKPRHTYHSIFTNNNTIHETLPGNLLKLVHQQTSFRVRWRRNVAWQRLLSQRTACLVRRAGFYVRRV